MIGYSTRMHTAEEMSAEDPFGGAGLFIPIPDSGEAILEALGEAFGSVLAVSWPGKGAWINLAVARLGREEALRIWAGDHAPAAA